MEILPQLPKVDLVLTDPPYGINLEYASYDDTPDSWRNLISFIIPWSKKNSQMAIMPCMRILELSWIYSNFPPDWLICWYKGSPGTCSYVGFNDWEPHLVYGKIKGCSMHDYFYAQPTSFKGTGHPCPKPIQWALWLISKATKDNHSILDPFMGSGTTLVAAKELGRKAIGVEMEEKYCEIAAKRLDAPSIMNLIKPKLTSGLFDKGIA
jgi:DNA modification methylase